VNPELLLLAALAIPAVGAVLIAISDGRPNQREAATLLAAVALFATVASLTPTVLAGEEPSTGAWTLMPGIELRLSAEPLGMLFALVASFLWIVNSLYSIGYMRANREPRQTSFYVCFAVALAATMGIAFAGNLVTLFLCYEALTLSTYPLVVHRRSEEAVHAGRIYLGLLLGSSLALFLTAIVWVHVIAGGGDFQPGGVLAGVSASTTGALLVLFAFGIGKAALMPVHRWLPAAMVAPTPVSALLHAVAVVKAGVFSLLKIVVYILGTDHLEATGVGGWLVYVAGFTILAASTIALFQDNLKRRLAYSTVSQLSYVVLAAILLAPLSIVAAALHIAAHAFGKITLFFAAGAIYTASHKTEVSQLDGIGRRMPLTMIAFAIGALSMIGLPPTAGFVSKWYLLSAAAETGQTVALAVLVISTLLNAAYFLPILYAAFFRPERPGDQAGPHGEAPWPIVVAQSVTALGCIAFFFFPQLALALAWGLARTGGPP
jgi:multicomponent Na+:H+ antiporter subunit D